MMINPLAFIDALAKAFNGPHDGRFVTRERLLEMRNTRWQQRERSHAGTAENKFAVSHQVPSVLKEIAYMHDLSKEDLRTAATMLSDVHPKAADLLLVLSEFAPSRP